MLPSVTIGLLLRERFPARPPGALTVFAAPDEYAPDVAREAEAVARVSPGARVLGPPQSDTGALLGAFTDSDTLHLAAHFVFAPEHPLSSRVRCADGFLSARAFLGHQRPGLRLVLTGCESARAAPGEERLGFVHTMLGAGASGVVATHWPLRDSFALDFFPRLYQAWGQQAPSDNGLSRALSRVQRALRDEPGLHQSWWAGISCFGGLGC